MGDSEKLPDSGPGSYRFVEHRRYLDAMSMGSALKALRSEAGETMVLQNNYFIEEILPNAILRKLSKEEMAEYRRPFAAPGEGRRPTLTWPRQIPIEGEPPDVTAIATEYADWLGTSDVPKLFLKAAGCDPRQ